MKFGRHNRIDTVEKIVALDYYLMNGDKPRFELIALDTETNGLHLHKTTIVGISLAINRTQGFYLPLLDWIPDKTSVKNRKIEGIQYKVYEHGHLECVWTGKIYPEFVTPKDYEAPEFLAPLLKRWFGNVNLVLHNAPFDICHLDINFEVDLASQVFCDTALLSHVLNENSPNGLKETSEEWKEELGINPHASAKQEQNELGITVIHNGGVFKPKTKHVWRANPREMAKYACQDAMLTFGLFEVGMEKYVQEYGDEMLPWFFDEEVMPLCREVVIPMKRQGVYIDVPYFEKLKAETHSKMLELEDRFIEAITPKLKGFPKGQSIEEAVSNQRLIKKIIELEGLEIPKKLDKKTGKWKETIAKGEVKKVYQQNPHWIWGYILGEDEIKYHPNKLKKIKEELYEEVTGHRYRFNLGSDFHLRWLFCEALGTDPKSLPQTDSATKDNPIPSMKAEVLEEHFLGKYPWVKDLLIYKKLHKLYGTYICPAVELNIDGWLYMDMKQNGTISGRFSCSGGFNLQTLPRVDDEMAALESCSKCGAEGEDIKILQEIEIIADRECKKCKHVEYGIVRSSAIKKGFIAPPGMKIVNADFSSLEPRCFAFMSGDEKLKQVYKDNLDLYSKIYCDMMEEPYRDLKKSGEKDKRNLIKPVVLGIPYGARDPQVANLMGLKTTITTKSGEEKEVLDVEKGAEYRTLYLETYEDLHKYMLDMESQCISQGWIKSLVGRRRHFQYAPFIYDLITAYDISVDAFLDMSYKSLEKPTCECGLDSEGLKIFAEAFRIKWADLADKGFWAYVRGLFKNEYNNAKNWPIQTLAGHIANRSMLETARFYRKHGLNAIIVLQVHDEITAYAALKDLDPAVKYLKLGMEENRYAKLIDIPMIADPIVADNLKEAK